MTGRPFGEPAARVPGACGSGEIAKGRPVPGETLAKAQEAAKAQEGAKARDGKRAVRIVRVGDMTTADFDGDRLTIIVDASGNVLDARCG